MATLPRDPPRRETEKNPKKNTYDATTAYGCSAPRPTHPNPCNPITPKALEIKRNSPPHYEQRERVLFVLLYFFSLAVRPPPTP